MLEFTDDPDWQKERAEQWKAVEEDIKDGLTRKRIKEFRSFYMTGVIPRGVKINPGDAIDLYPEASIEGFQNCLDINYSNGLKAHEIAELQKTLSIGVNGIIGLSREGQVEVFRYVIGETFDPQKMFPFRIGKKKEMYRLNIEPISILNVALISLVQWLEGIKYSDSYPFWADFPKFVLSTFIYINPKILTFYAAIQVDNRKKFSGDERMAIEYIWRLIRHCISFPKTVNKSTQGQQRKYFLEEFRTEFERLEEYPGDLKKIWREIEIQEDVVRPNIVESVWRKLTRKEVPHG